jgi:hypothetical protein
MPITLIRRKNNMKRNRKWFVHFPGDVYAIEFFDCKNLQEVKQSARKFLGVSRLPKGTEIWGNMNG